ncbi:hypothetical protein PROPEN_01145 [Proteus penneri ATCC 35198]|nr:hypothetical protein PROPEN_01145 [Proteus penneri ATCC 35198]
MLTLLHLLSSVALLVWGTHIVRTGIMRVFGSDLRRILGKSINKKSNAFLAGVGVTALVQSSNATALFGYLFCDARTYFDYTCTCYYVRCGCRYGTYGTSADV